MQPCAIASAQRGESLRFCLVGRDCSISGGTTYLLMLAEGLLQRGHDVTVAAGGGRALPCFRSMGAEHLWIPPPPLGRGSLPALLRRRQVDAVICSGRGRSLQMSVAAARATSTACICIVQDHLTDGQTATDFAGVDRLVALEEPIHEQLIARGISEERVILRPRPVRSRPMGQLPGTPPHALWMGRLSGNKAWSARALISALPLLVERFETLQVSIVGDGSGARRVRAEAQAVNRALRQAAISVDGFTLDPLSTLERATVVIGGGYTCLETLYNGRPAIAAGFGWFGPVSRERLPAGYDAHFGDRYCEQCGAETMADAVADVLGQMDGAGAGPKYTPTRDWFELDHSPHTHACDIENLVRELLT